MTLLWALGCAANDPRLVAHRALGVVPGSEENIPNHAIEAFEQGFGVELDLRLDGDGCDGDPSRAATEGCFDLGHTEPNGHTLSEVTEALAGLSPAPEGPLVLDVVDDPDHLVATQLIPYLAQGPEIDTPIIIQTSSAEGLAMLDASRDQLILPEQILLGLTSFTNPELTPPAGAELYVVNIAELPVLPLPLPVAVYGVATEHSFALAQTAASEVGWVITDLPARFAGR